MSMAILYRRIGSDAAVGTRVLANRRAVRIEPDFAPEGSVDIDLIGHGECESTKKPPEADPEAVGTGTRVENGETVFGGCRGDQNVGIAAPGDSPKRGEDEQTGGGEGGDVMLASAEHDGGDQSQ